MFCTYFLLLHPLHSLGTAMTRRLTEATWNYWNYKTHTELQQVIRLLESIRMADRALLAICFFSQVSGHGYSSSGEGHFSWSPHYSNHQVTRHVHGLSSYRAPPISKYKWKGGRMMILSHWKLTNKLTRNCRLC